jgi:transcriptional regulator with XRE-family HTH domain
MDSAALVQLALDALSCSQKELAQRLGVSPTQISKWKKGEHMSNEMEDRLREIAKIGDQYPSFVLWAGGAQEAAQWERLIHYLAEIAEAAAETGYNTSPLLDEYDERLLLCWHTFHVLREMGIDLPKRFPKDLDLDYESDNIEKLSDSIDQNPYSRLIYKIFASLNDVYGFYAAYVSELIQDDELGLQR